MAADDVEFGHVVDLTLGEPSGTELVADAAVGATTLSVDYAGDFEDSGKLMLNGMALAYTSITYGTAETDPDVITLAAPLVVAAATDDTVSRMAGGEVATDWLLHVSLGDGHPVDIPIPFEQRAMWSSVDPTTPVPVIVSSDLERLVEVPERTPLLDGSFIDPTTAPTGQAFSPDAPTTTAGYPEGYGWWQVDANGNVLGFWRLAGGAWVSQQVVTVEALKAGNVLTTALTGTTVTGATVQTRSAPERGIKLIAAVDDTGAPLDAFYVYDEAGTPFITAVPKSGMAVIAGELKSASLTVSPLQTDDKTSLAGLTEIVRTPDGTPGAVRLTAYTTRPASAPTLTTGYDTVQFTDDGKWGNRHGWATDGTNWFTVRNNQSGYVVEKWSTAGALLATSALFGTSYGTGCVVSGGNVYVLDYWVDTFAGVRHWSVDQWSASTLVFTKSGAWVNNDGTRDATIGVDAATGDLLIAQSRPTNADKVRTRRYTMPAIDGDNLVVGTFVDSDFAYANDLAGVTYGTHDLGANRYIFTGTANQQFKVVDSTGAAVSAEDWQAGMSPGKVGFAYTGGAFVSMDDSGLMRTYTGQDKATAIGNANLTKWVSNSLASATYETDQSPRAKITVPKRTKLNVTTSGINTGGTNAPDRVKVYVGQGATDPGRTAMWKQIDPAVGVTSTSFSSLATSGTVPPATNGFAAAGGTVQRLELADGTVVIDGLGAGSAWTTYTPTWTVVSGTNPTIGNGTLTGRYARGVRNTITFTITLTAGSTTNAGSGTYLFSLPVTARSAFEVTVPGVQNPPILALSGRGDSTTHIRFNLSSNNSAYSSTTAGITTGTVLQITGTYEAA